jgi:hypothetical protein
MARITKQDWKRLTKNIKYKGAVQRGVRWAPSRKDKALDRAWVKQLGERLPKED